MAKRCKICGKKLDDKGNCTNPKCPACKVAEIVDKAVESDNTSEK